MNKTQRLGEEKVSKLLLNFSIPAIVGMLVSALYNVIDRVFIGHSVGAPGIAGVTIGFPIMIIQMAFGALIGIGATSLISIRLGEGKHREAEKIMGNAIVLLGIATVALTVIGSLFLDPILRVFGASEAVLPYAREYMSIIIYGSIFQTFSFGMNNFIRAEGKPTIAMATMLIGTFLNVILAPLFIFVFHWGMRGAALATVLAQAVSFLWIMLYFVTGNSTLKIRRENLRLNLPLVGQILAIGTAPFFLQLAQCLLTAILNNSLEAYGGDIAVSGWGIVNSLMTLILMPIIGISQGAQPIIGYNYGARHYARIKAALKYAIMGATAIGVLGWIVTRLFPTQLIAIFDSSDPTLITFGSHALIIALLFMPVVGLQVIGSNYFQAIGKPKQSMVLSLSRQVLFLIPAVLILPHFFQMNGVLYSMPVADALSALVTGTRLYFEVKSLNRKRDGDDHDPVRLKLATEE